MIPDEALHIIPLPVERHGFRFIPPAEALLAGFPVVDYNLGLVGNDQSIRLKITTFPDLNGRPISLPRFVSEDTFEKNNGDFVLTALQDNKANIEYHPKGLEPKADLRFKEALAKGWPTLYAVHLACNNPDERIPDLPTPVSRVTLNVIGGPGAGKSAFLATLAMVSQESQYSLFSFDQFSRFSYQAYYEYFQAQGLTPKSPASDFLRVIADFRRNTPKPPGEIRDAKLLRVHLDEMIEALKNHLGSPVIIAEAVSAKADTGKGGRDTNAYDLATRASEAELFIGLASEDYNLEPEETLLLGLNHNSFTKKPFPRPQLGLFYRPDYSRKDPFGLRPDVLAGALEQFQALMPQVYQLATEFKATISENPKVPAT